MKITNSYLDGRLTVFLRGELDHHSARAASAGVCESIDSHLPRELILDFSGLDFMDSSGIAVIVSANRKVKSCGGSMLIENPQQQPMKVLTAAGIDRIVPVFAKGEVTT